jgi:hypothetical protein
MEQTSKKSKLPLHSDSVPPKLCAECKLPITLTEDHIGCTECFLWFNVKSAESFDVFVLSPR